MRFREAGGNKIVAERSGVPPSTLGVYLKGQEWKVSPALALARACGVTLEWLITGTEAKQPGEPAKIAIDQGGTFHHVTAHRQSEGTATKPTPDVEDVPPGLFTTVDVISLAAAMGLCRWRPT